MRLVRLLNGIDMLLRRYLGFVKEALGQGMPILKHRGVWRLKI